MAVKKRIPNKRYSRGLKRMTRVSEKRDNIHVAVQPKNYDYDVKDVEIGGKTYVAYFPEEHTALTGLVYRSWDANDDTRGGHTPWKRSECYALDIGSEEWRKIYYGTTEGFPTSIGLNSLFPGVKEIGTNHILFSLETDAFKEEYVKQESILVLRRRLDDVKNRLEELCGDSNPIH